MAQGFGQVVSVESKPLPLPFGQTVAYRDGRSGKIYADLDHATELLGVAFLPGEEGVQITLVKPMNGKFQGQVRRAIVTGDLQEIIKTAAEQGDPVAESFREELLLQGMKQMGITGGIIKDGMLIPTKADGTLMMEFAIPLSGDLPPELQEFLD